MPRNDTTRVDPRQTIDTSQSANVPLQVQADTRSVGRGGIGWVVAGALNQYAAGMADNAARKERERQKQQDDQDKKDGQAAAAEKAVTGIEKTADELAAHGQVFTKAYQESDGERHRYEFEQSLRPELARLEPGTDIGQFVQQKAAEYLQNNEMPEESRKSFMLAVAKAQPEWKIEATKHEITESLKREEENHQAILTGEIMRNGSLTADTLKSWQEKADLAGLNDYERDAMTAKAVVGALSSGKVNIDATLKTLDGEFGAGGRVLHDVYQEQIDSAAKQGRAVQEKEQKDAQASELTQVSFRLNDKADAGVLGDKEIELYRKRYDMSPEWAVSLHNRNREAQQRAAKDAEKDALKAQQTLAYLHGDAVQIERLGASKVYAAGEEALQESLAKSIQEKDFTGSRQYILAAARNNVKSDGFRRIVSGLGDTSNPKRFEMGYKLYKDALKVAPGWVEANMDSDALATYQVYDRRLSVYGDTNDQALAAATASKEINPETKAAQMRKINDKLPNAIPAKFEDSNWWKLKGATEVANRGYVETQLRRYIDDALNNGRFYGNTSDAIDFAWTRFKADHIQVGNRYEPTFGTAYTADRAETVGKAMTELGSEYKKKLVSHKVLDEEDQIGFAPTPNSPNRWQLWYVHGNVRRPVVDKDGNLVSAVASETADHYSRWEKQEKDRARTSKQGYKQYGLDFGDNTDKLKHIDEIPRGAVDNYMHGWNEVSLPAGLRTPELRKEARGFVTSPERTPQSFMDFINTTK